MANMYALWLTLHVGQKLQDGCPHLNLAELKKRWRALDKSESDMSYKDIDYGGIVNHYNNAKHMWCSVLYHKGNKAYLLCVINSRPTMLLY